MFISFCLLRRIDMGFIKMICNTMSHWVPIKYISEKYQIDENYICNLIVRKVVTSSDRKSVV